jgi:hypothetical protein
MRAREKSLEIVFVVAFSILVLTLFFALLSMNDLVLGNDPAVHLGRAEMFLAEGRISLSDIAWYPPLYHILLATLISFTGAMNIEQMLFLMKALTALIDWLLLFSVYLLGAKFFGKKYGVLASALMLLSFPLYEINFWGGYAGMLSLAFMCLLFLYLALVRKGLGPIVATFIIAFSLVLSHQLATFVAAIILPPFLLIMFIKSKGNFSKAWTAAILGGAIAFLIYYFQAIMSNIDVLISHVFFTIKTYLYQVPAVSAHSFIENFGFILFFAFFGVVLSFFRLREEKKLGYFLLLSLSLFVPLFLSQSYLFGLYLPYQWFIYFLMPSVAVFAAVAFSFIIDLFFVSYRKIKTERKMLMKIVSVSIVLVVFLVLLFRFQTVTNSIHESAYFYSTFDAGGCDAALWFKENFPDTTANVTVTQKPGSWFGLYSGRLVIAATDPIIDRNVVAETVLDLSYEMEHPLTMVRAYEAKGYISDENHVSINNVWRRVSYLSEQGVFVNFSQNGVEYHFDLSDLSREIVFEEQGYPKKLVIKYFNDAIALTESLLVQNDSYPITVGWTLSPLRSGIDDVTLYISNFFDLQFSFEKAYVPGSLDWDNPWSKPSYAQGNEWAVVTFSSENLTGNYLGAYDEKNEVIFALKFAELPDWGNVGALSSRQVDAFRFQYQFDKVNVNQTASVTYQILTFSKGSFPEMLQLPSELESLFELKPASAFQVTTRDYRSYIKEFGIEFLVYDKNRFDSKLLNSRILQLIYANDEYVICKIKTSPQ